MKNTASHITNLFRVNMPNEQSSREMKLAPSGSSCVLNLEESQNFIFFSLFIYLQFINQYHAIHLTKLKQIIYLLRFYMELKHKISHILPPSPKTFRGEPSFLEAGPEYLLYFNGPTVILRPYDNSAVLFINHSCSVTAVKYSFGYKQIASLDQKGNLMIHIISSQGSEKILRLLFNYQGIYLGGRSIDWTPDNKRICIVGTGKNRFGRVFGVETGADVGEITGVSANLSTVSIRPEKPFKLAAGGQQFTIKFYEGPPYKFQKSKISHKSYINQIKYSPDGKKFVSVGSDRKIVVYDGTTSEILKQLEGGHASGIMGVTWIDNQTFVTGSSDKKLKKWNCSLQLLAEAESNETKQQLALIDSFIVAVSYNATRQLIYYVLLSGQIKQIDQTLTKRGNSYEGYRGKIIKILPIPQQPDSCLLLDDGGKLLKFGVQKQKFTYERYFRRTLCYDKVFYDACISQAGIVYVLGSQYQLLTLNTKNSNTSSMKLQEARFIQAINSPHMNSFIAFSNNNLKIYQEINEKYEKVGEHKLVYEPKFIKMDGNSNPESSIIFVGSQKGFVQVFTVETIQDKSIKVGKLLQSQTNKNKITLIQKHNDIVFTGDSAGNIKVHQLTQENNKFQLTKVTDSMGGSHTTVINSILIVNSNIYTLSLDNKLSIWNLSDYSRFKTFLDVHRHGILCGEVVAGKVCSSGGDLLIKIHQL